MKVTKVIRKLLNQIGIDMHFVPIGFPVKQWPIHDKKPLSYYEVAKPFQSLYEIAQKKTQMTHNDNGSRRMRHYTLNQLLKQAPLNKGDVCELGCWRGLSAYQIATYLKSQGNTTFHIFDSFEGLSKIEEVDQPKDRKQDDEHVRKIFTGGEELVKSNLKEFDFIKYYKGWIPERFSEVQNKVFSFVHVDVDLYQPIYDSIEFFYPRMISGGIMVFDDYGLMQFPGAKKAVDEWIEKLNHPFFMSLPSGQAFLIKDK